MYMRMYMHMYMCIHIPEPWLCCPLGDVARMPMLPVFFFFPVFEDISAVKF